MNTGYDGNDCDQNWKTARVPAYEKYYTRLRLLQENFLAHAIVWTRVFPVWMICILWRLRLCSRRIHINTILDGIVDLCHDRLALSNEIRVALIGLCRNSSTESVMVVQQQFQAAQYHRSQTGLLEFGLLADQHLHVIWDRVANRVYDSVEDTARVRFVELRCEVGIDESFAVGDVDCADCSENLVVI